MRRIKALFAAIVLLVCLGGGASAQVLNLNPTYFAQYYWDTTSSTFLPCPNTSAAEPSAFTPQSITMAGLNSSLGQWTPGVGIASCLSGFAGVNEIIPSTGITCTPLVDGVCKGDVTLSSDVGAGLQMMISPPAAGVFLPIYPSGFTQSQSGSPMAVSANVTSAVLTKAACGNGGQPGCAYPNEGTVTWTFALPSYIHAANVTAVYATGIVGSTALPQNNSYTTTGTVQCVGVGGGGNVLYADYRDIPLKQVNSLLASTLGTDIASVTCTAHIYGYDPIQSGLIVNVPAILLQVADSVDTAPANTALNVAPPLEYNASANTLGIDTNTAFPGLNLLGQTVANLTLVPTTHATYRVYDGATATDCSTGGGSHVVDCMWSGTAWVGLATGGGGSSITWPANADLVISNTTNSPAGLPPQLNACVGGVAGPVFGDIACVSSLTTTGTSGAATFNATTGVLNIPQYSAGSSGVSSINSTTGAFTFTGSGVSCTSTTCTFTDGGGGTPGGTSGQPQYNNAGAFGGMAGWTYPGTAGMLNGVGADPLTSTTSYGYLTNALNGFDLAAGMAQYPNQAISAIAGGVAVPSGGTIHQVNGVYGGVTNASTSVNAVGGYFTGHCTANGTSCWGLNPNVWSDSGNTGVTLAGIETDVNNYDASNTVYGEAVAGIWSATPQPTSTAFKVSYMYDSVASQWPVAFKSDNGAAVQGLYIGSVDHNGSSSPSQTACYYTANGFSYAPSCMWADGSGNFVFHPFNGLSQFTGTLGASTLAGSSAQCVQADTSGHLSGTGAACGSGGSGGLSGMTAGQVPIAATATTVTSSKPLAGSGAGVTTGPTTAASGDVMTATGSAGQIADSGIAFASLAPLSSPTFTGTPTAPTATGGTDTTQLATTAFVQAAIAAAGTGAGIVTYSGPALTFTGTLYFPIGGGGLSSTTETNVDIDAPAAVTIQNQTVQMSVAPGVGNSIAYTWRKNGLDTAVTCTVSGASATSCSDTTHSFTTAALDLVDIKAVTTGTVVGTPTVVMAAQVGVPATTSTAFSAISSGTNTTAGMTVGSGASLAAAGSGTISATAIDGVVVTGTPTSGQVPTATSGSTATWQTLSGGGSAYPAWDFNDFITCCPGWTPTGAGSGGTILSTFNSFGGTAQGVMSVQSGGTANAWTTASLSSTNSIPTIYLSNTAGSFSTAARVQVSNLSSGEAAFTLGYTWSGGPNPVYEIGFHCASSLPNANWYAVTEDSGTEVKTDSGVACVGAWHQLQMTITNGAITWYVDGSSVATGTVTPSNTSWTLAFVAWPFSSTQFYVYVDWLATKNMAGVIFN